MKINEINDEIDDVEDTSSASSSDDEINGDQDEEHEELGGDQFSADEIIQLIQNAVSQIGEIYAFLGVPKHSTLEEIQYVYGEVVKVIDQGKVDNGEQLLEYLNVAYDVLSNPIARYIYDKEFYNVVVEYEKKKKAESGISDGGDDEELSDTGKIIYVIDRALVGLGQLVCTNISKVMMGHSKKQLIPTVKEMYNGGGLLSFVKGFLFSSVANMTQSSLYWSFCKIVKPSEKSANGVINLLGGLHYPILYLVDCIALSPFYMSDYSVVKKLLSGNGDKIDFKNLCLSMISATSVAMLNKYVLSFINDTVTQRLASSSNSEKSKTFLKFYSHFITQGILLGLVLTPLDTIRLQYPLQFIGSIVNNTPMTTVINPISMAIKIYNSKGLSGFFNGLLLKSVAYSLSNYE